MRGFDRRAPLLNAEMESRLVGQRVLIHLDCRVVQFIAPYLNPQTALHSGQLVV